VKEGILVGKSVGFADGTTVGVIGVAVGRTVEPEVGVAEGPNEGLTVGTDVSGIIFLQAYWY